MNQKVCPKCKNMMDGNHSMCPFCCYEFIDDGSTQSYSETTNKKKEYADKGKINNQEIVNHNINSNSDYEEMDDWKLHIWSTMNYI